MRNFSGRLPSRRAATGRKLAVRLLVKKSECQIDFLPHLHVDRASSLAITTNNDLSAYAIFLASQNLDTLRTSKGRAQQHRRGYERQQ
jgi:hypothetical protein